jgi:hypothetical protein
VHPQLALAFQQIQANDAELLARLAALTTPVSMLLTAYTWRCSVESFGRVTASNVA